MSDAASKPPTGRSSAKWAGVLLLLTAAATAVMVFARVAADVDEPTMAESLRAIPESRALFSLSAVARLVSGVTLIAAAWYLLRARSSPGSWTTSPAAFLLCLSGVCTVVSGAAGIILAVGASTGEPPALLESAYHARWLMGKVGFSLAGLALVAGVRLNGQSRAHRASWPSRRRCWALACCSYGGTQRQSFTGPWAFCSLSGCWPWGRRSSGAVRTRRSSGRGPRQPPSQNWAQHGPPLDLTGGGPFFIRGYPFR